MNPPPLPPSHPPTKCGLAVVSFILGTVGIVLCFGPLAGIPAVICGHVALFRIRKSVGALSDRGLAVAGLVIGYLSIVWITVIGPSLESRGEPSRRNDCVAKLRCIQKAKEIWAFEHKKTVTDIPRDSDLFCLHYIREKPVCPSRGIYSLNMVGENPTCTVPGHTL